MAGKSKKPTENVANLRFRAATEADYEAVMDVNRDVYNGIDYIPVYYMQYIRDPKRFLYVAEDSQGKVTVLSMSTSLGDLGKVLNGAAYRRAHAENHCETTTVLTARQARDILKRGDEVNTTRVVPEGMWLTGLCQPYGFVASNYDDMVKDAVVITRADDDEHIVAISFYTPYRCPIGVMYYMHFYSETRGEESIPLVKSHLLKQITLLQQHAVKENLLWLFMPENVPVEPVRGFVFDELGLRKTSHPVLTYSRMDMYCISRKLDNAPVKANM